MLNTKQLKGGFKRKMKLKRFPIFISLIFIGLIIVPNVGMSVSFGAHPKKSLMNLEPGESGSFEILFFSRGEKALEFYLSVREYPKSFTINYPESFNLESGFLDEEYVLIDEEYVKGKVVNVDVKVPDNAKSGEYIILLNVLSVDTESKGGFLSVNAEKTFLLKVKVGSDSVVEENATIKSIGGLEIAPEISGTTSEEPLEENITTEEEQKIVEEPETSDKEDKTTNPITGLLALVAENKLVIFTSIVLFVLVLIYFIHKKISGSRHKIDVSPEQDSTRGFEF